MTIQLSKKAIELRRLGHSYTEIARELKVSKTSVCGWVKDIKLTEAEKARLDVSLKSKVAKGRMKAMIAIRSRNVFKDKVAYENAEKDFAKFIKDPLFMLGVGLCTSAGIKKGNTFQFSTSNPEVMKIMVLWLEKYLNLPKNTMKFRLFIALSHKNGESLKFWSRSIGVPESHFLKTTYLRQTGKKGREYKGSISLTVSRIEVVRRVIAWQKLTMRYYG